MELLKKQQVDVVLATIDQKDADLEYRPVKMCEFVMAVGKNHHLATLAVAKEGFQYPWVDLKACEKEENVMLLPGSPFRQHADEIYGHYHLKPNVVYQISGTRTGLSSECENCLPAEQLASQLLMYGLHFCRYFFANIAP